MMHRPLRTTRTISNLQGRPGWYRITNQAAGPAQVTIYDEIGLLGVSADLFMRDLAGVEGDIEMHINSPGGDVFDGIAIYNQLKQRPGNVAVIVDGLAASAASFIAQAASPGRLGMSPHSQMMIHDGFALAIGNAADMRETADLLDKTSDNIAGIYADRTGRPAAYWRDKMRAETWLNDHEAVTEGLADYVVGDGQPAGRWDLSVYQNAAQPPSKKAKRPKNAKYSQAEVDALGAKGHAFKNPDGHYSYPIDDDEDLDNAIHAVGRGGADHDAIRAYIIRRANAMGSSSKIPDNWSSDGSMKTAADNLSVADLRAMFGAELSSSSAGKE